MRALIEHEDGTEIPLTPLIDVVFLLLIFFLVATSFTRRELDQNVNLPAAEGGEKSNLNKRNLVINIREDGTLVIAGRLLAESALPEAVTAWRAENPQMRVQLRGDGRVEYRQVMRVMGVCRAAGVERVDLPVLAVE